MGNILIIFGMLVVLMIIFVLSTYLNQKTEIPENCKQAYLEAQSCDTCGTHSDSKSGCGFQGALEFMKEIKL